MLADRESKIMIDHWDWMLNPQIFSKIQGPMMFATMEGEGP